MSDTGIVRYGLSSTAMSASFPADKLPRSFSSKAAHLHPFPQLLYAASGVMGVATDGGNWVIPPYRAMWLPAFCVHEVRMLTDANISSLMLQTSAGLETLDCSVLEVSPLLRALLLNVLTFDPSGARTEREQLMLQLLRTEIIEARVRLSPIPMPKEPKLYELCQKVMADLAVDYPLTHLAAEYGSAARTVARLFSRELGMSYRQWMDLVRVSYAQAQLDQGIRIGSRLHAKRLLRHDEAGFEPKTARAHRVAGRRGRMGRASTTELVHAHDAIGDGLGRRTVGIAR
ncbi:hypothetical protein [Ensifer sp. 4252]|uniref:hypothetical protein n=1 Tax=Ensifer sp. 4252 TaxID=3373915 RepID=UPI003D22B235